MNRLFLLTALFWFGSKTIAQTQLTGNFLQRIDSLVANMPEEDSTVFVLPTPAEQHRFYMATVNLFNNQYAAANVWADSVNYRITQFTDPNFPTKTLYLLEEKQPAVRHWGWVVYNPNGCSPYLNIQSPHPLHDFNTGKQGAYCFMHTDAMSFMISSAHRCNSNLPSSCDGTTTACGPSAPYAQSDNAHTVASAWQAATRAINLSYPGGYFVQLHGFSMQPTDPYVIMGNGTQATPPGVDKLVALKNALYAQDSVLTFKVGHIDTTWNRLLGTVNTQGRYLNGSLDPCDDNPAGTTGQFLHVEQEKLRLRQDIAGWDKMKNALLQAFACYPTSGLEETAFHFEANPNPSNGTVALEASGNWQYVVHNLAGQVAARGSFTNATTLHLTVPPGIYLLRMTCNDGKTASKKLLIQ